MASGPPQKRFAPMTGVPPSSDQALGRIITDIVRGFAGVEQQTSSISLALADEAHERSGRFETEIIVLTKGRVVKAFGGPLSTTFRVYELEERRVSACLGGAEWAAARESDSIVASFGEALRLCHRQLDSWPPFPPAAGPWQQGSASRVIETLKRTDTESVPGLLPLAHLEGSDAGDRDSMVTDKISPPSCHMIEQRLKFICEVPGSPEGLDYVRRVLLGQNLAMQQQVLGGGVMSTAGPLNNTLGCSSFERPSEKLFDEWLAFWRPLPPAAAPPAAASAAAAEEA